MNLAELNTRVDAIKEKAGFFMAKRRKDRELYAVLAETLSLCEEVEKNGLQETFRVQIAAQAKADRNRVYAERKSDVYIVVGRAVFEPELNRGSSWRYCSAMREAAKRDISGTDLAGWLGENGGVKTLFEGRGVLAKAVTTRTLHLNKSVQVSRTEPFMLTLQMDHRGFFNVVTKSSPS